MSIPLNVNPNRPTAIRLRTIVAGSGNPIAKIKAIGLACGRTENWVSRAMRGEFTPDEESMAKIEIIEGALP